MSTFFHDPFKIKISKSPNTQTQKYKDKCVNESIVLKISIDERANKIVKN